ncbi:MAG: hypothetical protein WCO56_19940 [Verrucomicrobiota bacterium]
MKYIRQCWSTTVVLGLLLGLSLATVQAENQSVKPVKQWRGTFPQPKDEG